MFKTEHVVHAKAQRPALDMVSTEPNTCTILYICSIAVMMYTVLTTRTL